MATIGNTLRLAVAGDDEISFYKEGPEQYPVKIRVLERSAARHRGDRPADRAGGHRAGAASTTSPRIERGLGPTTLQRSDRQFAVSLIADVAPGHALDEAVERRPQRFCAGLKMPPTMSFKLQGQSKILDETTANLVMAIGLAMIFVYMVLASQFESFLQPVVIMLVMPIAVPFALFTLLVDRPDAESLERARHAAAARHREEELDPAGGLRERAARARPAAARGDRRVVPHAAAADPDDDDRDRRRADPDLARHRHRRQRPRGDRA